MALIDRDALIEYMMPYLHNEDELQPADVIADIRVQPVIDAKPVVRGEWIEEPYLLGVTRRCNVCGENYGMPHGVFNYCPNCGADMRGDTNASTD